MTAANRVWTEVLFSPTQDHQDPSTKYFLAMTWTMWVELLWVLGDWTSCLQVAKAAVACDFSSSSKRIELNDAPLMTTTEKLQLLRSLRSSVQKEQAVPNCSVLAIAEHILQDTSVGDELIKSLQIYLDAIKSCENQWHLPLVLMCQKFLTMSLRARRKSVLRHREIRALTTRLLNEFPNNTILLHLLVSQEQYARLEQNVRHIMEELVLFDTHTDSEVCWQHALAAELAHARTSSVRNLIDRALHASPHSQSVWHAALDFEIRLAQSATSTRVSSSTSSSLPASRIKALVYQALRFFPFDKGTYSNILINSSISDSTACYAPCTAPRVHNGRSANPHEISRRVSVTHVLRHVR